MICLNWKHQNEAHPEVALSHWRTEKQGSWEPRTWGGRGLKTKGHRRPGEGLPSLPPGFTDLISTMGPGWLFRDESEPRRVEGLREDQQGQVDSDAWRSQTYAATGSPTATLSGHLPCQLHPSKEPGQVWTEEGPWRSLVHSVSWALLEFGSSYLNGLYFKLLEEFHNSCVHLIY